jgi:hypothetical protein
MHAPVTEVDQTAGRSRGMMGRAEMVRVRVVSRKEARRVAISSSDHRPEMAGSVKVARRGCRYRRSARGNMRRRATSRMPRKGRFGFMVTMP